VRKSAFSHLYGSRPFGSRPHPVDAICDSLNAWSFQDRSEVPARAEKLAVAFRLTAKVRSTGAPWKGRPDPGGHRYRGPDGRRLLNCWMIELFRGEWMLGYVWEIEPLQFTADPFEVQFRPGSW
jgi:hypothetical protein